MLTILQHFRKPEGSANFTVGQAEGSGTYVTGKDPATLSNGDYYWRIKAIDDELAESTWNTANSGNIAFTMDTVAPTGVGNRNTFSSTTDNTPEWNLNIGFITDDVSSSGSLTLEWSEDSELCIRGIQLCRCSMAN